MSRSDLTAADQVRLAARDRLMKLMIETQGRDGLCFTALAIDGWLEAISTFLVTLVGERNAYERLQKTCDAIALRVAEKNMAQQGEVK